MNITRSSTRWWLGVIAAGAVACLALYPQFDLRRTRGPEWNGSYAYIDTDEVAYSAYLNALIDGRPRRNDPYTGRDNSNLTPQAESLFSIQFVPAYLSARFATFMGLDAATAFVCLMGLGAVGSTLAIFWLFSQVTGDDRWSAAGALAVLCLGTLVSGHGAIRYLFGVNAAYNYLPFLRRYIPLIPFPFFFLFAALCWRMLNADSSKARLVNALGAGAAFAVLVYSYFFLWTAALAWLGCVVLVLLVVRPERWKEAIAGVGMVLLIAIAALGPYLMLVSRRAKTMDAAQLLHLTHSPDLLRVPEILGFLTIALLAFQIWRTNPAWRNYRTVFAAACALLPCAVFNQQIMTGRSLQPIHYEQFIANYVAVVAIITTLFIVGQTAAKGLRRTKTLHLAAVGIAALCWGITETVMATRIYAGYNIERDEAWAVSKRLRVDTAKRVQNGGPRPVVLSADDLLADDIPTATPDAVLWARHMHVFAGVDLAENKRRFYQLLYYTGVTVEEIREGLTQHEFYYTVALFGWDRANFNLTSDPRPLTTAEIDEELQRFSAFVNSFDRKVAAEPTLSYVVTYADEGPPLANLDKWYDRDAGERIGVFILYKVSLRE